MTWLCGDEFGVEMAHHKSLETLWEQVWKPLCARNIYPFLYAKVEDVQPVIDELRAKKVEDAYLDAWPETFLPHMRRMEREAQEAEAAADFKMAESLYLRGASLGMIGRFPIISSPVRREIWALQKRMYLRGTSFWEAPVQNVLVPYPSISGSSGEGKHVQAFVRRPPLSAVPAKTPVFLTLTGLDGYRTEASPELSHLAIKLGFTTVSFEIPGTGDAPGSPNDPASSDRQVSAVLDWIRESAGLDEQRILVLGTSTGGYDAMRVAHTCHDRLAYVIAQGGASDLTFSREWLDAADGGEYAFGIVEALRVKFGYDSVEALKAGARDRFSLVRTGIFDGPCTKLMLLNGVKDTIFPIEDSIAALEHGVPKMVRLMPNRAHMGEPEASGYIKKIMMDFSTGAA